MNELVIPPAPLWYKSSVAVCSPDNILVYGSKNDLVVIRDKGPEETAEIKIIQAAHTKNVTSVSLNKRWKEPHSYIVSLGEDSIMKVWDLETFQKKFSNKEHLEHKQSVVGAVFAGDDRVVSAAINGLIVVWNINTNESKTFRDLFNTKVTLTCLSSCPHVGWLVAFGLNNGCVIIADLRRNGKVLYKLRGHYEAVVSLSWCPAPINVFPRHVLNTVKNKSTEVKEQKQSVEKHDKPNPWINLVHADDGEVSSTQNDPLEVSVDDFLKECDILKNKILGLDTPLANGDIKEESSQEEPNESKQHYEEKGIEETETSQKLDKNRVLPKLFDPSGDFLDDSMLDLTDAEIVEDKDTGDEKSKNSDNMVNEKEEKTDEGAKGEDSGITTDDQVSEKPETIEEEPRTEYLLASSGKDRSIYIWRAGTDGRMQTFFHVPKKLKNKDSKNPNVWITVCWITPGTILTSSQTGDILVWPLPKPKESSKQYRVLHTEHSSIVFNMVSPPKYLTPYNWRDETDLLLWSWSQDGKLINYNLNTQQVNLCYSTITASITCFSSSALDPNRLAIGCRDGNIHIWDLSLPHLNIITMQKFQQKFTHKVSTIAWNPTKEMILGFGTEEGRVGFIDMASKKSTLFPHYFHNQVYKAEWGPLHGDVSNLGFYVVAEGKIGIYDTQQPNSNPVQLDLPKELYVYKFAWKPDFSLLLLNGKDGSLVILTTDLVAITTIYLNDKGLNGIVWHPEAFTDKTEVSSRCNWFAATTSKGLLVYDCTLFKENLSTSENFMEKIVVTFEGHLRPPLSLAWCPFDSDKLVSTAADGLVHVWDVTTKTAISTFVDPYLYHNPAVTWSPIDPNLIIIGDRVIRVWSMLKNPPKIDEEFMTARKSLLAKSKNDYDKTEKTKIKVDIPAIKTCPKNCIVPALYVSNDENLNLQIARMRKLMTNKENQSFEENDYSKLDPLQLFGEKEQVSQLLLANYDQQKLGGRYKSCELISLWKGNIGECIEQAINENRVTPTIITLAPMVSLKLWQDACEVYAKKLSESANSDPLEAAMYFLACHKVEEAINCLCLNLMFKEALTLAKHRLPSNSDIIITVTEKWAEYCITTGNFETAAFCYISIGQYLNAAKVLARRNNKEFLEFAAELAEKEGNKELYDSIRFKCNEIQTEGQSVTEDTLPSRIDAILDEKTRNDSEGTSQSHPEIKEKISEEGDQLSLFDAEGNNEVLTFSIQENEEIKKNERNEE